MGEQADRLARGEWYLDDGELQRRRRECWIQLDCFNSAQRFDVRHTSPDQPIRMLSGGNIQKFILGRELLRQPLLVIANQPTWGLDVGAVAWIHDQLRAARERGAAVLLISEELEEIFSLADRVAVMFHGRMTEARPLAAWTAGSIGLAMAGQPDRVPA